MYSNRQFGISKFRRSFAIESLLGGFANLPIAGFPSQRDSNPQTPSPMYSNRVSRKCVVTKNDQRSFEQRDTLLYHAELQRQIVHDGLSKNRVALVGLEPTTYGL